MEPSGWLKITSNKVVCVESQALDKSTEPVDYGKQKYV